MSNISAAEILRLSSFLNKRYLTLFGRFVLYGLVANFSNTLVHVLIITFLLDKLKIKEEKNSLRTLKTRSSPRDV